MPDFVLAFAHSAEPFVRAALGLSLRVADILPGSTVSALNLACLLVMAADKSAAILRLRRVPEWVPLALAVTGAGPALLLSRWALRHKTRRWVFAAAGWTGCFSALAWLQP